MPVFRYQKETKVEDGNEVILRIELPDNGSAAPHIIDIPGPHDKDGLNDCEVSLGIGSTLKTERTLVYSKPVNVDYNNDSIRVKYFIDNVLVLEHSNLKSVDVSPQIVLKLTFI